jgi:predicted  nucleic acid-binding Zn-ribbon protein
MAQPDDIDARVTALEGEVRQLSQRVRATEHDAAAARVLAGGADRDVHEVRDELRAFRQATISSFNALRADLTDLREHVDNGFTEVNGRLAAVDRGFAEVRGRLDGAAAGQQQIVDMLTLLINRETDRPGEP